MNRITKNLNKTIYYLLFIVSGIHFSCTEKFLEIDANEITIDEISSEQAVELVNSTYNILLSWQVSSFSWNAISSISSDDADKGSDQGDTGADKHLFDILAHDATSISVAEVWEGHYKGIQRANQAINRIKLFEDLDSELKQRLTGEAKFLRALLYFRLLQTYGGVPIINETPDINSSIETLLRRASRAEVFEFIEIDLIESINVLPEKSEYPDNQLGRATKGAARTLLAKVSMYQTKWETVLELTNEVIKSGEYNLTPKYEDIWKEIGENNQESIFEIQAKGELPSVGVDQYSLTQGARGEGGWGWGFNVPSDNLLNSYDPNDLRRDATIIFRGETLYDGRFVPETVVNPMYNQKAYSSAFTDYQQTGKNIRILRFAEVLLMNAEAAIQLGGDVAGPLNQVRNRAGLEPIDNPSQSDVWNERRWELAFEHDRYFDLVRQGQAATVLQSQGIPFKVGKHELFPIPQVQINLSGGILQQNPGWE
jgi:hypothetical protein